MCGRFALANPTPTFGPYDISPLYALPPRYNIAPRTDIFFIAKNHHSIFIDKRPWGIPWTTTHATTKFIINAKSETVHEKKMFRNSFFSSRCVVLSTGFFEWDSQKQPYYFFSSSCPVLGFAGIFHHEVVLLTTSATESVSSVHSRMPVIISPLDVEKWLDNTTSANDLQTIMKKNSSCNLVTYPVSHRVNSPINDSSSLIEPTQKSQLF
jgi:putative SOS response-associated peptidase YedK